MSVVVTGGRPGIGAAIAAWFEARGGTVAVLDVAPGAPFPSLAGLRTAPRRRQSR